MGQYWTKKNDQDDQDAEKTANPWAEKQVKGDRNLPDKEPTEYEKYCRMMAQQQEDEMDETIFEDELTNEARAETSSLGYALQGGRRPLGQLKEYQPEGVFVRGH